MTHAHSASARQQSSVPSTMAHARAGRVKCEAVIPGGGALLPLALRMGAVFAAMPMAAVVDGGCR